MGFYKGTWREDSWSPAFYIKMTWQELSPMSLAIITHYGPPFLEGRNGAMPHSHIDSAIKWMLLQSIEVYIFMCFGCFLYPCSWAMKQPGACRWLTAQRLPISPESKCLRRVQAAASPLSSHTTSTSPTMQVGTSYGCWLNCFVPIYWVLHKGGIN